MMDVKMELEKDNNEEQSISFLLDRFKKFTQRYEFGGTHANRGYTLESGLTTFERPALIPVVT